MFVWNPLPVLVIGLVTGDENDYYIFNGFRPSWLKHQGIGLEAVFFEYSHEIAPLVANSAPLILTDEHHLIA